MNRIEPYISAILGWFIGDFIGVVAAFLLAREFFQSKENVSSSESIDSYKISLLKLSSLLISADGNVDEREVKFVREYFKKTFGERQSNTAFKQLKSNLISNDINVLSRKIKESIDPKSYYSILMYLYSIAAADGVIDSREDDFILKVAKVLGVEHIVESVRNQFVKTESKSKSTKYSSKVIDALKILGLKEGASKDDIKSAYRKLAKEFHPDKLAGMSEGIIKLAKEKFQEIQSSYEYLNNNYV